MNPKQNSFLPYGRQQIDDADIAAVIDVLKSDYLTCGPAVDAFEHAFANKVGAKDSVVVSNGTAALHLAALTLGLNAKDTVIVPTLTFLATASAPHLTGAEIIFSDVDPNTGLMTAETFSDALSRAQRKVRAVFPVHLNGACVDLESISKIAKKNNISIIDDACHALGASMDGVPIGNGQQSDMTIYSMHPVKTIAMGEGGAITTNNPDIAQKLRAYRNHGINREPELFMQPNEGFDSNGLPHPWYYEMSFPGLNYRASDIHCALGLSQLKKLDAFRQKRENLANLYDEKIANMPHFIRPVPRVAGCKGGWHLYPIHIDFDEAGISRADLMRALRSRNIGTQVHYFPVHRQPYWRTLYPNLALPGADRYYARCLSLPLFPAMTDDDVGSVINAIKEALKI